MGLARRLLPVMLKRMNEKHQKDIRGFSEDALELLSAWHYPGNVRELENAIERAVVLCPSDTIDKSQLPPVMLEHSTSAPSPVPVSGLVFQPGMTMAQLERAAIEATLKHTDGDKNLTAKLLGVSLRTLYRRLEED